MTKFQNLMRVSLAACLIASASPAAFAEESKIPKKMPAPFTEDQRAALEDFVRDFILDNPEVLMESVNRYQQQQSQKRDNEAIGVLKSEGAYLYHNPALPSTGNPKADMTVVEFFDFNCGYCKRAYDAVQKTLDNDKNIRFVFVDLPILSPQSKTAAQWALAAHKQGKYFEFYKALLTSHEPKTEETLAQIAKSLGLDPVKLKADAASKDIEAILNKNADLAHKLNISGTPGFVIGNQIVRGYVEYEGFKTIIGDERKNQTPSK